MSKTDRDYYRERATQERELAATATSVAAEIHLELACLYEKLVKLQEGDPLTILEDRLRA